MSLTIDQIKRAKIGDEVSDRDGKQYKVTQYTKDMVEDPHLTGSNMSLFVKIQGHLDGLYKSKNNSNIIPFHFQCYRDIARALLEAAEVQRIQISAISQINKHAQSMPNKLTKGVPSSCTKLISALDDICGIPRDVLDKAIFSSVALK